MIVNSRRVIFMIGGDLPFLRLIITVEDVVYEYCVIESY